jgi:hypothetical protein
MSGYETIWDLLQEGPQDLRVCRTCTSSPSLLTSCSAVLALLVHCMPTVLQATQLGTLGITAPHICTYPEYSWVVPCGVLCYAVGVLCSALLVVLYAAMYYKPLLHHPSHVVCIHRGGGYYSLVSWLR